MSQIDAAEGALPRGLRHLSLVNLVFTLVVILWGALVRKTHSGAGCGDHWPLCNGDVVPLSPTLETLIEFTHRLTSGVALIGVLAMWLWTLLRVPQGHSVRRYAFWSFVIMVVEALIGAGLVIFGLVEKNESLMRAVVIAIHQANTLLLLSFLTLTVLVARTGRQPHFKLLFARPAQAAFFAGYGLLLVLITAFGAIAALGNTLFPASSLVDGMVSRADATAHFLERLTVIHPLLAIFGGLSLIGVVQIQLVTSRSDEVTWRRAGHVLTSLVLANLVIGALDVALLAPLALSSLHLLMADLIWLSFIWYGFERACLTTAEAPAPSGLGVSDASHQGALLPRPMTSKSFSKESR